MPATSRTAILGFYLQGTPKAYYDELLKRNPDIGFKELNKCLSEKLVACRGADHAALEISMTKQKGNETELLLRDLEK